jgi:hypothetical protein
MHLSLLEDYISELSMVTLDDPDYAVYASDVCTTLWEILIIEEKRIPDFIIDGDKIAIDNHSQTLILKENSEEVGEMKKLMWLGVTVFVGLFSFLYGFFIAP